MPYVLQAVKKKHVRAKPGGAALTNTLSCSSIRPLFSLHQDEPGKYPAWQIWILFILIHTLELTISLLAESISSCKTVNTAQHHLSVKTMPCQGWFAWWFVPVTRTTNTVKHQRLAVTMVSSLPHTSHNDHQDEASPPNASLAVSNQIKKKKKKTPFAVTEVPAHVIAH